MLLAGGHRRLITTLGAVAVRRTVRGGRGGGCVRWSSAAMINATTTDAGGFPKLENTSLFLCDVQDRFADVIHNWDGVVATARLMVKVAQTLELPLLATEHYPKAFGRTEATIPGLLRSSEDPAREAEEKTGEEKAEETGEGSTPVAAARFPVFEKRLFSMLTDEVEEHWRSTFAGQLGESERPHVLLFGIEGHVCIMQTCLDLISQGAIVYVVCDGVSSQRPYDRAVALKRMEAAGAVMTTAESIIFQLVGDSEHVKFRQIANLIKEHNAADPMPFAPQASL